MFKAVLNLFGVQVQEETVQMQEMIRTMPPIQRTTLDYHCKEDPAIIQPLPIQVYLHSIENKTGHDLVLMNEELKNRTLIQEKAIPKTHALLDMNLAIASPNILVYQHPYSDSVKDRLEQITLTYAAHEQVNFRWPRAALQVWINKSKLRLEAKMQLSHVLRKEPSAVWPIGIDKADKYYLSLILAGEVFEHSQISIGQ